MQKYPILIILLLLLVNICSIFLPFLGFGFEIFIFVTNPLVVVLTPLIWGMVYYRYFSEIINNRRKEPTTITIVYVGIILIPVYVMNLLIWIILLDRNRHVLMGF